MRGEHENAPLGNLRGIVHEHRAPTFQLTDHMRVVHDLLANVDRLAKPLKRTLHRLHRAVHAGAVPARLGDEDSPGWLGHVPIVSDPRDHQKSRVRLTTSREQGQKPAIETTYAAPWQMTGAMHAIFRSWHQVLAAANHGSGTPGTWTSRRKDEEAMTMRWPDEFAEQVKAAPVKVARGVFSGLGRLLLAADRLKAETGGSGTDPGTQGGTHRVGSANPAGSAAPGQPGSGQLRSSQPGSSHQDGSARSGEPHRRSWAGGLADTRHPDGQRSRSARATRSGQPRKSGNARSTAPDRDSRWPSLDRTNNVRLLTAEDLAELAEDKPAEEPAQTAASAPLQHAATGRESTDREGAMGSVAAPAEDPPAAPDTHAVIPAARHATDSEDSQLVPPGDGPPGSVGLPPIPDYDQLTLPSLRARLRGLDQTQLRALIEYEQANADRPDVVTMFERRIGKLGVAQP